ncbi:MAG: hypothetical protein CMD35_07025 [Flavobacteriales bacterium]|nr:hypothetical protein [Flavobacteriales bacterium]
MRHSILIILFTVFSLIVFSQGNSPFSQFGPGDFYLSNFQSNFSRGGIGASSFSGNTLNPINPASYSQITLTTGETGIYSSNNFVKYGEKNGFFNYTNLSSFGLGLPLKKGMGLAFGLTPYSKQNFEKIYEDSINNNPIEYVYSGDGGLSKVFLGYGIEIKNISFGLNGHYIFGRLNSINKVKHPTEDNLTYNSLRIRNYSNVNGFGFNTGLQLNFPISDNNYVKLGGSFELGKDYATSNYRIGNYFNEQSHQNPELGNVEIHQNENIIDTRETPEKGQISLPSQLQFGLSVGKHEKWEGSLEFRHNNLSTYQLNDEASNLGNRSTVIAGARIVPNSKALGKSNYWKTITYNFGGFYGNSGYFLNNNELYEFGINFAFGLPMKKFKYQTETFGSSVFLGFGYSSRANYKNNYYENYLNINASIVLNDKWFIKRKFQ